MDYSLEALGQVVRDLRGKKGLTQEEFGRLAGYQGGAGVSISRLENGRLAPSPELFEGIARELDVSPDELDALAVARTNGPQSATRGGSVSIKDRVTRFQREIDGRTQLVTDLGQAFNEAHDRAEVDFLRRFAEIAAHVDGALPPDPAQLEADDIPNVKAEAAYRVRFTKYRVQQALAGTAEGAATGTAGGAAAAYEQFTAAVAFAPDSTGAAISGLTGVAATDAARAVLLRLGVRRVAKDDGGIAAPIALGIATLPRIVAIPVTLLAAGGLLWMTKRNREQQQELTVKLDHVEAEIAETQPNVDALRELMPRATEILEYIAVHAGHALNRWEAHIGDGPLDMQSLSTGEQERYRAFVEVAAVQLAVATLEFEDLMANRGGELERATALADEILTQSRKVITSHV